MGLNFCDVLEIANQCFLIVGRHLNIAKQEADVANAIIYKADDILYIIDTGAIECFAAKLKEVARMLAPYDTIILINTHGHADHVGNNDLINELESKHKAHFISAHDLDMMRDNLSFFEYDFKTIEPYFCGKTAHEHVARLLDLFMPINVDTPYLKTLETQKVQDIQIGNIHWSGWNFNDDIYVMKTQGHSAGHVVVYFPKMKHLHLADETNGYCNLFHDCDHLKSLESHTKSLSMLNEGTVNSITDGHTFMLHQTEEAKHWLSNLINGHYVFSNFIRELLDKHSEGLNLEEIYDALSSSPIIQTLPAGANPNPTYSKLQILSKFRDLGVIGDNTDLTKARFQFK